eukprot:1531288-Rhodomonas_salina.1
MVTVEVRAQHGSSVEVWCSCLISRSLVLLSRPARPACCVVTSRCCPGLMTRTGRPVSAFRIVSPPARPAGAGAPAARCRRPPSR